MERIPPIQGSAAQRISAVRCPIGLVKKLTVYLVCVALTLSGCAANPVLSPGQSVGLPPSSTLADTPAPKRRTVSTNREKDKTNRLLSQKPRLDIIIPVFDPGLEGTSAKDEVWPELRRAEANRFAHKLKLALEETGTFGAVRVTPDTTATGDLYVMGRIHESTGERVEIGLEVRDISGAAWSGRSFAHTVDNRFHKNIRHKGQDPYDPVFRSAAQYLVQQLQQRPAADLEQLKMLTDLRFGVSLAEEAFSEHLKQDDGRFALASYPSSADPMLRRTRAIRVRDQLFVDDLQEHYRLFSEKMNTSYLVWQEQSLAEVEAERQTRRKALVQGLAGAVLLGLGVAGIAMAPQGNLGTVATTAGLASGVAGAVMLGKSFQTSKEAKVHRDALNELGESIDVELASQVVAFEKDTEKLTGTAKEQFGQWRAFLKKIYQQERTPEVEL